MNTVYNHLFGHTLVILAAKYNLSSLVLDVDIFLQPPFGLGPEFPDSRVYAIDERELKL